MSVEQSEPTVGLVTGADMRRGSPGGTRTYVLGLAQFLVSQHISVDLFSNGSVDGIPRGCRIRPASTSRRRTSSAFRRALSTARVQSELSECNLLHFQRPDDILALRDGATTAVCTLHGHPSVGIRRRHGRLVGFAYERMEASALERFRAIIAVDPRTAKHYRMRYPGLASRIHHVPNAVSGDGKESCGVRSRSDRPVYLYAGRLSVEKRAEEIIRAVRGLDATLLIAGSGLEEAHLRKIANGSDTMFLGNVAHEDMAELYHRADALVLASEYEGLPTVALEALAAGCPVVGLEGCGLEEMAQRQGVIIASDLNALPGSMREAADLRASPMKVSLPDEYRWSHVGPRLLAIYRDVAPGVFA